MGWAAYEVERTVYATGEKLGKMTIFFPKVESRLRYDPYQNLTMADLMQYPDFPVEATVFAIDDAIPAIQEYGFRHVINANELDGQALVLSNGSSMRFVQNPNYHGSVDIYYDTVAKGFVGNTAVYYKNENNEHFAVIVFSYCVYGDKETKPSSLVYYYRNKLVNLNEYQGYFPTRTLPSSLSRVYFFDGAEPIYITSDPYGDGGESETGGGEGDFDNTSEDIAIPALPALSAVDTGFITLFNPTLTEMTNLASYMWSDLFDVNGWKKVFADPMQAILGLSIVPVDVPASTSKPVKVGNISTDVVMTVAASQYVEVDCGTLNVNEYWGAYLDYEPYTKAEIYLPYIGIHALSTDDIMGKAVHVVYHVDILSGSCCAYVKCGGSVLYSFVGQCSSSIPITGDNWTSVINGALSIAGSIGSMVATGGASAPSAIGNIASTAVNSMKPSIEKSGSMGGTGGLLGVQTPYLILTRPRQAVPRDQNKYIGYPSFITIKLSDLSGYTEIDSIHLENISATENELGEIESILKAGVIF